MAEWTETALQAHAQDAVEPELFTIPAYLCAYHSIVQNPSKAAASAAEALRVVANQEMMHLELVSNLCNALGRAPASPAAPRPATPAASPTSGTTWRSPWARPAPTRSSASGPSSCPPRAPPTPPRPTCRRRTSTRPSAPSTPR